MKVLVQALLLEWYRSCIAVSIHRRPIFFDVLEELTDKKCVVGRAAVKITFPPVQSVPTVSHLGYHLPSFGLSLIPPNVSFYGPFQALPLRLQNLSQDAILSVGFDRILTHVNF